MLTGSIEEHWLRVQHTNSCEDAQKNLARWKLEKATDCAIEQGLTPARAQIALYIDKVPEDEWSNKGQLKQQREILSKGIGQGHHFTANCVATLGLFLENTPDGSGIVLLHDHTMR